MKRGQDLAKYGEKLDLAKRLSYGVNKSAHNLIDERAKAEPISIEISNKTPDTQFLVLSSLYNGSKNATIFNTVSEMLAKAVPGVSVSNVWALQNGKITGTLPDTLDVASKTTGREVNQLLNYIAFAPTRITKLRVKSTTVAGAPDLGNLDNQIKTIFFSPFAQPVENQLAFSPLVQTNNNFSPNILDINLIDEAFPLILSNEHFTILQINAGTVLNITLSIGAQDSPAQRHWRTMKNADDIIRAEEL